MLTRQDIAAMLNVSMETLRRRIETRQDFPRPALRLSRKTVRWEPAEVKRWIERQRASAA